MTESSGRLTRRLARTVARLVGACAVATALVAVPTVTTSTLSAAAGAVDGPSYGRPTVGQCRDYTWTAATRASNSSPVVACSARHTAEVVAAPLLPDALSWDSPLTAIERAVQRACWPEVWSALGGTHRVRSMSAYGLIWFMPTQAQRDHGARWVRCDVTRWGGQRLLPINDKVTLPPAPLPDRYARCQRIMDGDVFMTACNQRHDYRAKFTVLVDSETYPGSSGFQRIAADRCSRLGKGWYATWPNRTLWRLGNHHLVCFQRTTA